MAATPPKKLEYNRQRRRGLTEEQKAANRERGRKYYAENRERILGRNQAYRAANPEKVRAWSKKAYVERPHEAKARSRKYYEANRDKVNAASRAWIERNPEKRREILQTYRDRHPGRERESWLRRNYGIGIEEYERLLAAQGGCCALCKRPRGPKHRLAVDHDHETGANRGLLCSRCNRALGSLGDSLPRLRAVVAYLESPPASQINNREPAWEIPLYMQ